jgi:HK97 family phage major capsid protein
MKALSILESETHATTARVRAEIGAIRQRAADEDRAETAQERAEIDRLLREGNAAKARLDRVRSEDDYTAKMAAFEAGGPFAGTAPTTLGYGGAIAKLGAQVVRSEAYQWVQRTHGARPERWQSPSAEFAYEALWAATLTSDGASGGDLVIPDVRPAIIPGFTRPVVLTDLIATGSTDSNAVSYMVETTFTNAADTVAEGAAKPEATLAFDAVVVPVRKIAQWLPVTDEMLEDVAQIRSYIDVRLRLGITLAEEDQLLNGTTTPPDIVGIRNRSGLATAVAMGTDTPPDAIFRQITAIRNGTGLAPDGIVMNPADWESMQLMKFEPSGEYVGAGPFERPVAPTLWGLPVAITTVMPAGTALVGAFRTGAQIFRKGGVRVDISNSHADFFVKNLVAIRAEVRLALAVYRPAAFGEVTGLGGA